jgi:hypothetical protein
LVFYHERERERERERGRERGEGERERGGREGGRDKKRNSSFLFYILVDFLLLVGLSFKFLAAKVSRLPDY